MRRLNKEEFMSRSNKTHNNKYDYSLVEYKNGYTKVEIICHEHGLFQQRPDHHLDGRGCKKCSTKSKKHISNKNEYSRLFIEKSKKIHNNKYDYSLVEYKNARTKVKIICPEHGIFEQNPDTHLKGHNCLKCSITINSDNQTYDNNTFIKKAISIHSNNYDYSKTNYIRSKEKVLIICPEHGYFYQMPYNHLLGKGCKKCNESKGEKIIRCYLEENLIRFESEKSFEECKNIKKLRFDFYLPEYNLCIEYDGIQHFKPLEFWGGNEALLERKKCDLIKTDFCISNNINLLRINYKENIKNKLKEYFRLLK